MALWAGVNTLGLAQESSAPRDIIDAIDNMFQLIDLPARVGGDLRGVYAWNFNVKGQGIYNYNGGTTYDAAAMEAAVNRAFPLLRTRLTNLKTQPLQAVIVVSPRELYNTIAKNHSADLPPEWF